MLAEQFKATAAFNEIDGGIRCLRRAPARNYTDEVMKNGNGKKLDDDFIAPARRAFRRVARQLRAEHAKLGLPLVLGEKGKVRLVYVRQK